MLHTLNIKNFALIADQTIEFKQGFNVLIGETGAGKSLILDALSFVLGDKANKLNIRHGEQKMSVQAVFDNSPRLKQFLEDNDIDEDDNLIVRRSLTIDGKSDCRINGTIVSAGTLKTLASIILDTYAQNENIELLKVKHHIAILDEYAEENLKETKQEIALKIEELKSITAKMELLGGNSVNRERELELLEYQIKDIENANIYVGEDDELKTNLDRLSNIEKIHDGVKGASEYLNSVCDGLDQSERLLIQVGRFDESILELSSRLNSCRIETKDILETLSNYDDGGFDQNEIDKLSLRQDEIKSLKKKYGASIEDILSYLDKIKEEYDNLLFGEEKLAKMQKQKDVLVKELYTLCQKLSNIRQQIAKEIEEKVVLELLTLGFKNCKFKIYFKPMPNINEANFTKNGLDEVEFLFSANAGEELKSLSKTISGGEMSRFMLAIKNVFANSNSVGTLVFDEVDTGISGEIGQKVAERLAMLSKNYQLICITHLCQVTAMADNYIFVKKEAIDGKTYTKVKELSSEEIIKYIAVVSGATPTEAAIRFASELKQKANEFKKTI